MPTCFVIQPFDSGKFDKRYADVFKPAIEAAGLEAYRVDHDPTVEVPIDAIEEGIRNAAVCLADITTDNPNVWYELGYAFATGQSVLMVCSQERGTTRYPFDIQHRTVIQYAVEAPQDFERLKLSLSDRLTALMNKSEALRQIAESQQVAPSHGLSQHELLVLAVLAGETSIPGSTMNSWSLKTQAERAGLTAIGFSLAFRRLQSKGLIEYTREEDPERNEVYDGYQVTEKGWIWIESNESLFSLKRQTPAETDDDIPF